MFVVCIAAKRFMCSAGHPNSQCPSVMERFQRMMSFTLVNWLFQPLCTARIQQECFCVNLVPQLLMMRVTIAGSAQSMLVSGSACAVGCSTMTMMDQGRVSLVAAV